MQVDTAITPKTHCREHNISTTSKNLVFRHLGQPLFTRLWAATEEPTLGCVLIIHGMGEHGGRYQPLAVTAKVRMVSDGDFLSETFKLLWHAGPTVVLEIRSYTVVVSSRACHLFDRSFFRAHGQEPDRFDAVVMKSPHCEPHMFKDWASLYLDVDAPGSTSANLKSLGHTVCGRPIFPLDEDVVFEPRCEVYKR